MFRSFLHLFLAYSDPGMQRNTKVNHVMQTSRMATFTPPSVLTTTNDLGLISNSALQSLLESHDAKELNPIIARTMVTGLHFFN